jgi:hypothetical protein
MNPVRAEIPSKTENACMDRANRPVSIHHCRDITVDACTVQVPKIGMLVSDILTNCSKQCPMVLKCTILHLMCPSAGTNIEENMIIRRDYHGWQLSQVC